MTDDELIASVLPSYEIGAELGRGGWGVVLAGRHRTLGRAVAIKQLPRAFAADPEVRSRFVAEAKTLAALSHPHIVPVYDYVEQHDMCLLVMEALPGGTVWSRFVDHGFAPETSCVVMLAALAGLEAAHQRGVLHRDVKPENLLFSSDGVLKVVDFGIAKVVGGTRTVATRAGELIGTPVYMAPEQITGGELGPPTDVYAAAVMMYELLAGRLPFEQGGSPIMVVYRHVHEDPVPLRDVAPQIGPEIAAVVMRGLARDVADRYATAEEFAVAIGRAATAYWGPGWQEQTGIPLLATPRVLATTAASGLVAPHAVPTERGPAGDTVVGGAGGDTVIGGAAPPTTGRETNVIGAAPPAPGTVPPPSGSEADAVPGAAAPTVTPPAAERLTEPQPARTTSVVRPQVVEHVAAARLADVEPADLVPVERLVSPRRAALLPAAIALALLLATCAVALVGLSSPNRSGELARGEVIIAGVDVAGSRTVVLDLTEEIPVELAARPGGLDAVEVDLSLSALGVPLGSASSDPIEAATGPGGGATVVNLSGSRYLVAGTVTGEVVVRDAAGAERAHQFAAESDANGWLTIPGVASVVAVLVVLAFAESSLRSLRRGRKPIAARVSLVVVGAALGVAATLVGWVAGAGEPATNTIVVAAVLGAATGVAAGVAAGKLGAAGKRTAPKPSRA